MLSHMPGASRFSPVSLERMPPFTGLLSPQTAKAVTQRTTTPPTLLQNRRLIRIPVGIPINQQPLLRLLRDGRGTDGEKIRNPDIRQNSKPENRADIKSHNNVNKSDDNNEELTPPPDSPMEETMSQASSVLPSAAQDEIVVGTNAHKRSSPAQAPEPEDVVMGDTDEKPSIINPSKRKRVSGVYAESVGEKDSSPAPTEDLESRRSNRPTKAQNVGGTKGVLLGYWRDSPAVREEDKHAVVGFIDVRDRLRTRIQPTTRSGQPMDPRYPIPPGPGGSWVTFDKVAFDPHLVGHNHHVIKEYVKIRAEDNRKDETVEERARLDVEAVELAAERVRTNPPPDAAVAPLVAYGPQIPANAVVPNRPENKKRRLAGSFGVPSDSPKSTQNPLDDIPGTRPTRVPIGVWKLSSEKELKDKHAVFGVLGGNDMFRVKLTRETRDGRTVIGNFPNGAGALWIHWDEVEFDPHLKGLSRNEVKEYCRIRQRQLDLGEAPKDVAANETKAVLEAQQRVAQSLAMGTPTRREDSDLLPIAMKGSAATNGNGSNPGCPTSSSFTPARPNEEVRQSRRLENGPRAAAAAAGRHPLPDLEYRAANRTPPGPSPAALERTNMLARREIARLEAAQARADLRAANRETSIAPAAANAAAAAAGLGSNSNNSTASGNGISNIPDHFQDNVSRLNKVWEAQEANRLRVGSEDAKIYMGVKYQRKQSGPFQGKLVSQGMIITIDGEDYVEYRVLTKPTFF
ncbi:uncharacterized protein P884DRAFT_98143 [Thermothelomyces heterothallicus CBS 202.75]|uniref:uncharacterized protein n=1 Tax=Thermothelomyces heterothallicus CBS 202.75 TaxID=1149848 RepID=UPI0037435005